MHVAEARAVLIDTNFLYVLVLAKYTSRINWEVQIFSLHMYL